MPSKKEVVEALYLTREAEILLNEANLADYPASVAAREHLVAAGSEIVNILEARRPHVPQAMSRTQEQLAGDMRFMIVSLLDQLDEPRLLAERFDESEDPLPQFEEADLDYLLETVGRLRRWATGIEVGVRNLRQRMNERDRRSN